MYKKTIIINTYLAGGTTYDAAKAADCGIVYVWQIASMFKLKFARHVKVYKNRKELSPAEITRLKKLYIEGTNFRTIAVELGVTRPAIYYHLKKWKWRKP